MFIQNFSKIIKRITYYNKITIFVFMFLSQTINLAICTDKLSCCRAFYKFSNICHQTQHGRTGPPPPVY